MKALARGRGFDVIVVGEGLAGRVAALHCARHGLKTLVLEGNDPRTFPSAASQNSPSPVMVRREAETIGAVVADDLWPAAIAHNGSSWHVATRIGTFQAPRLVNAAGRRAAEIAARLGDAIPHRFETCLCMVTAPLDQLAELPHPLQNDGLVLRQLDDGRVLIRRDMPSVTHDADGLDPASPLAFASTARTLCEHMPSLRHAEVVRVWTERELRLPDNQPVMGPSDRVPGLFHLFGFGEEAAILAGGAALAECIATGLGGPDAQQLRIGRFAEET